MQPPPPPVITLTTDFGERDSYVAQMKGVIASIAPTVPIIDLSHQLPPQDLASAERFLAQALPLFPPGSVHVAVIDPGVGGARRPIALECDGRWMVGPDNGIFTPFFEGSAWRAVHLDRPEYWRPATSTTFHGRDIFAPVGAHLATGVELTSLGTVLTDPLRSSPRRPLRRASSLEGEILHVDHFGNLVSNIHISDLRASSSDPAPPYLLRIGDHCIEGPERSYNARAKGELLSLIGSSGHVEISVNLGRADQRLGVGVGATLTLAPADASGG